jgi:hypothetical protein
LDRYFTTVPYVIDTLINKTRTWFPEFVVSDGRPNRQEEIAPDLVCIGYTGIDGEEAVTNRREREQLTNSPERETYEITNIVSSWHGENSDAAYVRNVCYTFLDQMNMYLMKDQTLDGLVMRIRLISDDMAADLTPKGAICTVRFLFRVDAYTR